MHVENADLSLRERLAHWLAHLSHVLPAQAPIRDFVHHNTLHGFQHLPFREALATAQRLTGARAYWPEARFRQCLAEGRILPDDLLAALGEVGECGVGELAAQVVGRITRGDILCAALCIDDACAEATHVDWLLREQGLAADGLFALCSELLKPSACEVESLDWVAVAQARWRELAERVGREWSLRALLEYLTGVDVLAGVSTVLQRHLAAHLDLGVAAWRNPVRPAGFYAAWRASAGRDLHWEFDELPNVRDEIAHLPDDPLAVLAEELPRLLPEADWYPYLQRLMLEMPGWSGMMLWRDQHPEFGDGTPVAMVDYLAVRVLLERLLCEDLLRRLTGIGLPTHALNELEAHFAAHPAELFVRDAWRSRPLPDELLARVAALLGRHESRPAADEWLALATAIAALPAPPEAGAARRLAALCRQLGLQAADLLLWRVEDARNLLAEAERLSPLQRGEVWLLAYERRYREGIFSALAANHGHATLPPVTSAQVVMCMDDREEGTRRHLEEIAPAIETFGAAGFFGVPMYWQGLDDAGRTALCPVVVQPTVLMRELPTEDAAGAHARHAQRQTQRLRWRERLYQSTRRDLLAGPALSALAALPALAALGADMLAPAWFGERLRRWREQYDGEVPTRLAVTATDKQAATPSAPQAGWTDDEQAERVEAFLRTIGLTGNFAPLVLILGHGSSSLNNPHRSAYDCGACSGRHGGPNARVFATLANRPPVRERLARRGLVIPATTWFVAAFHNTCDDAVDWYDLDTLPSAFQPALDVLVAQLAEACRAHAAERCRRLASAPERPTPWVALRHVAGRASDLSQARPELGHATNAAAFIGRRSMSRGLFLDRRVFLISYDPVQDEGGRIVENILLAAGPVGAGISLEYYFSSVDNERYGCGSKVTHNLTGLFGVMDGADSDLRTGLPRQMIEIHEPMRLLVVVEQTTEVLSAIVARQPALQELIGNAWIVVAACHPESGELHRFVPGQGWQVWQGGEALPRVARSSDWFAGERGPLPPAILMGGRAR